MRASQRYPLLFLAASCLAAATVSLLAAQSPADGAKAVSGKGAQAATIRGRVVCLAEEMHRLHGADLPTDHPHVVGIKTTDGRYYTLLRTRLSEGLFVDEELRSRELILLGRLFPGSQVFEMTSIRSVKDGVICDVYFRCDVCAIQTLKPGECMCCQDPVILTEKRIE